MRILPISRPRHLVPLGRLTLGIVASLLFLSSAFGGNSSSPASTAKPVHVRQYTRKDGTVVRAHDRAARGIATPRPRATQSSAAAKYPNNALPKTSVPATSHLATGTTASAKTTPSNLAKVSTPAASPVRSANGRIERSAAAKSGFQRSHPCPSTGASTGSCPGYIVDHVRPLACGGADAPANMQWQTVAAAKEKDKTERIGCTSSR